MNNTILNTAVAVILTGLASTASANNIEYNYQGRITYISDSSVFGGAVSGDYFNGSFSYDSSLQPSSTQAWWLANYSLNNTANTITAIPGGVSFSEVISSAIVANGPAYPYVKYDAFLLNDYDFQDPVKIDPLFVKNGGSPTSIYLLFDSVGNSNPFTSTSLPTTLSLDSLPYSGGNLTYLSGSVPQSGQIYVIERNKGFYDPTQSLICYECYGPGTVLDIPFIEGNSDYQLYLGWVAEGNTPMYLDSMQFQLTSLAPVAEADTSAMLLTGLGVIGFMARRRRNSQV